VNGPRPGTRGPAFVAFVFGLASLAGCGRDASPPPVAAAHPAAAAAAAMLVAVDTNDPARFAALTADRKDRAAAPARADDVAGTVQDLHERYGLRARSVGAPVPAGDAEADVEVVVEGGAATLTLTLRRAADGAWRVVGLAEAAPPTTTSDGPPADRPAPAPHAPAR